jgi:anti-anti-sigma factor
VLDDRLDNWRDRMSNDRRFVVGPQRPSMANHDLEIVVSHQGPGRATMRLRGELDLAATGRLAAQLDHLRERGCRHLGVDLADLDFISASGISELLRAAHDYSIDGHLEVINPSPLCRRVLIATDHQHLLGPRPPRTGDRAGSSVTH